MTAQGVEYIVAPNEADAQLAYLSRNGLVDAVITEDSDMIPYHCPCVNRTRIRNLFTQVIFKLDKSGNGFMVQLTDITSSGSVFANLSLKVSTAVY